jgi:hypothetical protein
LGSRSGFDISVADFRDKNSDRFRSNEVRLWLTIIAYDLGNLWRRLALPQRIGNWSLTSLTCPVLLAIAGREPSDRPAVRRDGATDGGSHDPSRVEPQVVAMKKSIPAKTPKEAVSEESGSGSGDSGLRGLRDGGFGADHPLGERMCSVGRNWVYAFNRRMAKKLIPAKERTTEASNE